MTKASRQFKKFVYSNCPDSWNNVQKLLLFEFLNNVRLMCSADSDPYLLNRFNDDMEKYAKQPGGLASEYCVILSDDKMTGVQKAWLEYIKTASQLDTDEKLEATMKQDKYFMDTCSTEPTETQLQRYRDYVMMDCDPYLANCDDDGNAVIRVNWHLGDAY